MAETVAVPWKLADEIVSLLLAIQSETGTAVSITEGQPQQRTWEYNEDRAARLYQLATDLIFFRDEADKQGPRDNRELRREPTDQDLRISIVNGILMVMSQKAPKDIIDAADAIYRFVKAEPQRGPKAVD